jgi:hypothetical protein
VIKAIQNRHDRGLPLHSSAVVADDKPLAGASRRWFGSWDAALRAAGIDPEAVRNPRAERAPPGTWSAARVLELIREHAGAGADLAGPTAGYATSQTRGGRTDRHSGLDAAP